MDRLWRKSCQKIVTTSPVDNRELIPMVQDSYQHTYERTRTQDLPGFQAFIHISTPPTTVTAKIYSLYLSIDLEQTERKLST